MEKGFSLTYKVLIAFLLILIPMFAAIFAVFSHARDELEKEVFASLQRYTDEREGFVLLYLEMSRARIQDFATDDYIVRSLDQLKERMITGRLLSDYIRTYKLPLLRSMYRLSIITGADGRVLASTMPWLQGRDLSKEEFFIRGLKSVYIAEVTRGLSGMPEVSVSAPIYSRVEKGKVIGVITGFVELSKFAEFFTGEYLRDIGALTWTSKYYWETMEIYLVNRDRLMITESRFIPGAVLRQRVDTVPVRSCLEKLREFTGIYKDYRGVEVAGASMCIPVMGWTLISEVDSEELLHGVRELQLYTGILTGVIILFTGALVFYFMRIIVLDLRRLVGGARAISIGNYDIFIPVRRKDEIGVLSAAFNDMAQSIKTRTAELEKEREGLANAQRVAHLGSWEWDMKKDIVYWSEETYRIFGVARQEFGATLEKYLNLIHPDDMDMVRDRVSAALYQGKTYQLEHRIIRKDGSERILFCEGAVSFDAEGKPDTMSGIVQDITERRIAERALEESEMRYRTLIESLQEGIMVIDENNTVTYLNPRMAEMLGLTVLEMMDRPIFDFMDAEEIERAKARIARRRRGIKELTDAEFIKKNGARLYAALAASPIMEGGEYKGAIAGIIDVTERRKAEDALKESEERLRAILDGMDNSVFMNDMEGRMIFINKAFSSGLGKAQEELHGKTVFDIMPAEVAERLHRGDLRVIEADAPVQTEEEIPLPDGIHYGLLTRFVLKDKFGKKYAFCGIVTDITALKRAEEALRKSESSLKEAQRIANIGNWEWDIPNNYVHRSDEVYRIYGKSKEEFTTYEDLIDAIHPEDREFVRRSIDDALKGKPYSLDARIIRDGEERYVHIQGELVRDEAGNPARMVGIVQDITERKRAEEEVLKLSRELEKRVEERTAELKKAMEGLAAANREIETFTYSVAHDLRSPLRLIDGFSILLLKKQKDKLDADGQDQLNRIRGAARRMGQLIDDLLNLSYVMRSEVSYGRVNLSGLAWGMITDLQKAAPERKVRIKIEEGMAVRGDEGLMRMVVENLLGNAWKFTSKTEEAAIEVGISGEEYGRTVFCVRDNGVGFDMRYAERLFQPFQRLHPAEEFPGTGIGLATVQRIMQRHGGRIWAESGPGMGAAFYFTLEKEQ
ncbi:MAG: hypothetical protein A2054_05500 [Deltaproteobacteria bacterium GWA2_55_10]|nr:MAG: hypothetical protein A2054_05500 [Deltaproteobacteria bacterium GWA2_55_10]